MHKARYWLLLKIARRPRVFIYGAGILVAIVLMLAILFTAAWLDQTRTAQGHRDAIGIFHELSTESTELLDHLITHDALDCGNENLMHLNAHLLQSRYIREIGLLNEDQGLICSTALGRLPAPIKGDYPVHVSHSGMELLNDVPLAMADKMLAAVIIQRPPFNVAISPYVTGDIYASADVAWLRMAGGLTLLRAAVAPENVSAMQARANGLKRSNVAWQGLKYELTTVVPDRDLVLQSQRHLGAIAQQNGTLLFTLLGGAVLVAALAAVAITPFVRRLARLRNRIGFLCNEDHLALVYQPVFDLATHRVVGCEVLARLKEAEQTWMPDDMIPAILSAGLAYEFDRAVTQKAIRELAAHLPAQERKFCIALNYFPNSLSPDNLVPVLVQALEATGRHDLEICIEITEHSLSSELFAEVQRLKAQGFLIAVDDFGTGYSNLKSVTRLSPDLLKIDRSFVFELEDATLRSTLIPEIVNIAQAINAQTVAEGIETPGQARLLAAAGVRYGQGYALARPMDIAQLITLIQH